MTEVLDDVLEALESSRLKEWIVTSSGPQLFQVDRTRLTHAPVQ